MVNYTPKLSDPANQGPAVEFGLVSDVMETNFASFRPKMTMEEAVKTILKTETTGGPVLSDAGTLVGFLSERDCLRLAVECRYHNVHGGLVESYMRPDVVTVREDAGLFELVDMFIANWYHIYPVVNRAAEVVGVVSRKRVIREIDQMVQTTW